jgi:hypothetical protein
MSVMQIAAPAEGELVAYLKALGYEVDWDFRVSLGRWLEVYDGDRMVLQIDEWAPLDDFLECLPGLVELRSPFDGKRTCSPRLGDALSELEAPGDIPWLNVRTANQMSRSWGQSLAYLDTVN